MFNKKRMVVFGLFILLMFFLTTFAGEPAQNASVIVRDVIFTDTYDGSNISEQKVELGKAAEVPKDPYHRDFIFVGWYQHDDHKVKVEKESFDKIMENTHVDALYKADKNNNGIPDDEDTYYVVKFIDSLDKKELKSEKVLVGLDATAPEAPVHNNYEFTGWDKEIGLLTEDVTYKATYSYQEVYTVTYHIDGGNWNYYSYDDNEGTIQKLLKSASTSVMSEKSSLIIYGLIGLCVFEFIVLIASVSSKNKKLKKALRNKLDTKTEYEKSLSNDTLESGELYESSEEYDETSDDLENDSVEEEVEQEDIDTTEKEVDHVSDERFGYTAYVSDSVSNVFNSSKKEKKISKKKKKNDDDEMFQF